MYSGGYVCKEIVSYNVIKGVIIIPLWDSLYENKTINLKDIHQLFYVKKIIEWAITF